MSVFTYKKKSFDTNFRSRAEAFNSMLAYLIEERKIDPMQAAKEANQFAEIFAVNMGLPTTVEPERKGYDKVMYYVKETVTMVKENPEIVNFLIPAATFVAGLFTGKKVEQNQDPQPEQPPQQQYEPINFDEVK